MVLFKFQYDNTLSKEKKIEKISIISFKFQYDNTLSLVTAAINLLLVVFKFQYDNTLRGNVCKRNKSEVYLNSNMIIL